MDSIILELKEKLIDKAYWFPTSNMPIVDLICFLEKAAKYIDIRKVIKQTWEVHLKGILCYTEVEAVCCDISSDTHSSIFDAGAVIGHSDHTVKFISWYGNELSHINKVMDIMDYVTSKHLSKRKGEIFGC